MEQKTWISNVWKYCLDTGITIQTGMEEHVKMRREHDKSLMQLFYKMGNRGKTLRSLNRCRLYMKVNTITGLAIMDGTKLRQEAIEVKRSEQFQTREEWPNQNRLGPRERGEWTREIQKLMSH